MREVRVFPFIGLALAIGLSQMTQAQKIWEQGKTSTTTEMSVPFKGGGLSVRYVILRNVVFHGPQDGNWINDGARFDRDGHLFDPGTGCYLGQIQPDVVIPILKLDYCRLVPLFYAIGTDEAHGTAIFSAASIEYYYK
jgi:hypothetical protein